jgi:N-acetylglucosaminyldiphosphoundecaprenol N-acetyl-beta-D-mannosaminyltransferase
MSTRARILNAVFDRVTLDQSVERVIAHVKAGERGWLCTVNVAILMMMRRDPWLQGFVDRAAFVVADGQPLVWFAPTFGERLPARVTGVDLVHALSRRAQSEGLRVGLVGGRREEVDAAALRLLRYYPGLRLAYVGDGYFGPNDAAARAHEIAAAKVDILFVGMGVPRQERFIDEEWERLGVRLAIGVGGTFDVLAGLRVRAPSLVQKAGLEWAFRLVQEPRRLWKRYLATNSQFLWLVGRQLWKNKRPEGALHEPPEAVTRDADSAPPREGPASKGS